MYNILLFFFRFLTRRERKFLSSANLNWIKSFNTPFETIEYFSFEGKSLIFQACQYVKKKGKEAIMKKKCWKCSSIPRITSADSVAKLIWIRELHSSDCHKAVSPWWFPRNPKLLFFHWSAKRRGGCPNT